MSAANVIQNKHLKSRFRNGNDRVPSRVLSAIIDCGRARVRMRVRKKQIANGRGRERERGRGREYRRNHFHKFNVLSLFSLDVMGEFSKGE